MLREKSNHNNKHANHNLVSPVPKECLDATGRHRLPTPEQYLSGKSRFFFRIQFCASKLCINSKWREAPVFYFLLKHDCIVFTKWCVFTMQWIKYKREIKCIFNFVQNHGQLSSVHHRSSSRWSVCWKRQYYSPEVGAVIAKFWQKQAYAGQAAWASRAAMLEGLTHLVPRNKALILQGRAHAAKRNEAPVLQTQLCCLGKHSQTETRFKMNFLPMKGQNSITSYCIVLIFKLARMQWLVKEILFF